MTLDAEVARMLAWLERPDLPSALMQEELPSWPPEVRDAVVRAVARTFSPPPSARVLSGLLMLRTPENEDDVAAAYQANVGSPDPRARQTSLYGLDLMGHPTAADVAVHALRDPDDYVVAAAADLVARRAADPGRARALLQGVYEAHQGDRAFYQTLATLQGHGIGDGPPGEVGAGGGATG